MPAKPKTKKTPTKKSTAKTTRSKASVVYNRKPNSWLQNKWAAALIILVVVGIGIATLAFSRAATASGVITGIGKKCVDNMDNRMVNGNKIVLWTCDGTAAQRWTLPGDGTIRTGSFCLDVPGQSKATKTYVQLYKCNGTVAQKWTVRTNGSIVNPNSGLCLDAKNASTANGTRLWMWTCNGTAAQKWTVPKAATPPAPTPTPPTPTPTPPTPTPTPPTPPTSGNNPSGEAMPGAVAGWTQIFADDFTGTVPKGAFSDCNHNVDTPQAYCGGLKNYGAYYTNWWAYPNTWGDTAKTGADGNTGAPFGGTYHPETTTSVDNGAMHINMFRPTSGGDNHVAALVPRKCMDRKYGRYVERFKVTHADPGFKSAHLFYQGGFEIDFPENDYGETISAYMHPGGANFSTNAKWTTWHTSAIEWTASSVKFYLDGKLIGTATNKVPNVPMSWVLQNESSILGPYAKPGASAQLDIDWVACYSQS